MKIILPWPPKELSPNARVHWAAKSKAAKAYRHACRVLFMAAGIKAPPGKIVLTLEFVPPTRHSMDDDNLIARFKAGRDGIADALGVDDKHFTTQFWLRSEPVKGGSVIAEITSQKKMNEDAPC